jgi:putative transposase
MHQKGIAALYPGANLSKRHRQHGVYPFLLRHITAPHPNQIWGVDISSVGLRSSWLYLGRATFVETPISFGDTTW